ncbi:MAG: NAD-dependent epimerase/dehydratase family protein [Chloroflexi bacterium]|nr:NAD-dependent epimerase/dehydratase family protein [Chloroflexota bacterium]
MAYQNQKVKRILVTGGAGFIGANLVRMLLENGYQLTVLDNLSAGGREYLDGLSIEFIQGDILDVELVNHVVPGHDGIVHLAAQTGVPGSLQNPRRDCEVNVVGTLNMLEACRHTGVSRFVFASSNAPLGRQPPPATEDKAPLPISPYGASKLAGEGYCLAYRGSWGLETVVLRFGNVYGPFSAHKNSVVAKFFKDILTKGEITIDGDGEQTRDFIYVDDLCRAILLALESNVSGEVFQIATGLETSILELAALVEKTVHRSIGIQHGPPRHGDIRKNYTLITKARRILGYEPFVELPAGLGQTHAWFSNEMARWRS